MELVEYQTVAHNPFKDLELCHFNRPRARAVISTVTLDNSGSVSETEIVKNSKFGEKTQAS